MGVSLRRFSFVWLLYVLLWVGANWPALHSAWWHTDDFTRASVFDPLYSLHHGRPAEVPLFALLLLEHGRWGAWFNIGFRLLQVAVHGLNTLLIAYSLQRVIKRWMALSAVLFFLLWPFQGEAVLWRSAITYPVAACFSLGAAILIGSGRRTLSLAGAGLLIVAVLTNQLAALAGGIVWILVQALALFKEDRLLPHFRLEGAIWLGSYLIGALTSRAVIWATLGEAGRAALPTSLADKVYFWLELNRQYLAAPHDPPLLTGLHLTLLVAAGLTVVFAWLQRKVTLRQALAGGGMLAALLFLPYLPVLLTVESSAAWRILYLAPLLSVGAWLILQHGMSERRLGALIGIGILSLFLAIYFPMNFRNAADYVKVFTADRAVLRQIETLAANHQPPLTRVVVATYPAYRRAWDLHGVTYMHYDSKQSAFLHDWSAIPFINWFSKLAPAPAVANPWQQEGELAQQCVDLCWLDQQQQPWQLLEMTDQRMLCVCP